MYTEQEVFIVNIVFLAWSHLHYHQGHILATSQLGHKKH